MVAPSIFRYFVKPHFGGWREVTYEKYKAFIKNILHGATAIPDSKKEEYIKKVTRIELKGGE